MDPRCLLIMAHVSMRKDADLRINRLHKAAFRPALSTSTSDSVTLLTEFLLLFPQLIDLLLLLKLLQLLLMLELIERLPALGLVELFFLPELIELLLLSKLILLSFELKLV